MGRVGDLDCSASPFRLVFAALALSSIHSAEGFDPVHLRLRLPRQRSPVLLSHAHREASQWRVPSDATMIRSEPGIASGFSEVAPALELAVARQRLLDYERGDMLQEEGQQPPKPPAQSLKLGVVLSFTMLALTGWALMPAAIPVLSGMAAAAPFAFAIGMATAQGIGSDAFAQFAVERLRVGGLSRTYSLSRTLSFAAFNVLYVGIFGYFKHNHIYAALFGTVKTVQAIACKVFVDLFGVAPLFYFPFFFIFKGALAGQDPLTSLRAYKTNSLALLRKYWLIWVPCACLALLLRPFCPLPMLAHGPTSKTPFLWPMTAGETLMWLFVPPQLRVPYLCAVSLVWQILLSTISNRGATKVIDQVEPKVEESDVEDHIIGAYECTGGVCLLWDAEEGDDLRRADGPKEIRANMYAFATA
jgi:hypothetical protein